MECPFCTGQSRDDAWVCCHCGRDLKLPQPLVEEHQELVAKLAELKAEVERLRDELKRGPRRAGWGAGWTALFARK
jgi:hypothetical protein